MTADEAILLARKALAEARVLYGPRPRMEHVGDALLTLCSYDGVPAWRHALGNPPALCRKGKGGACPGGQIMAGLLVAWGVGALEVDDGHRCCCTHLARWRVPPEVRGGFDA